LGEVLPNFFLPLGFIWGCSGILLWRSCSGHPLSPNATKLQLLFFKAFGFEEFLVAVLSGVVLLIVLGISLN
jgi:hypothetical protein